MKKSISVINFFIYSIIECKRNLTKKIFFPCVFTGFIDQSSTFVKRFPNCKQGNNNRKKTTFFTLYEIMYRNLHFFIIIKIIAMQSIYTNKIYWHRRRHVICHQFFCVGKKNSIFSSSTTVKNLQQFSSEMFFQPPPQQQQQHYRLLFHIKFNRQSNKIFNYIQQTETKQQQQQINKFINQMCSSSRNFCFHSIKF